MRGEAVTRKKHSVATRYHNRTPDRPPLEQLPMDPELLARKQASAKGSLTAQQNRKTREQANGN